MLGVAIKTQNTFYELGLLSLLKQVFDKEGYEDYLFICLDETKAVHKANIIFKDFMVIVNIYQDNGVITNSTSSSNKPMMTINIPFNSNKLDIYNIISKIKKILVIAHLSHCSIMNSDISRRLGLNNYVQLSLTESKIVELTGQGYSTVDISKILERSEKTILTHRRNAIRKLGVLNRLDFYNYATNMSNYSNKETVFICI
ncbi:helix-turn-helix transcriptional regulator [Yersinia pekkanenii]|uniref:LuxR family regulatory protein n=1 Tax=Yersinia pekkanenii TaxID=1288385 RepID=A0A0T9Q7U8_9GAMM|nr:LuxR family transcriptional regulator [Yersinia pekkanenii]CNH99673.1 LuxR family regulatory protein [Yersinia pekkanenii]CRY65035.1 LuxR family regulatory protein [Yersinia pekkanenii]